MFHFLLLKKSSHFIFVFAVIALVSSCQKQEITGYANLSVTPPSFELIHHSEYMDLPNGVYQPSDPNFSMNNPATWTGNMAQYVVNRYTYLVRYDVKNFGNGTAYGAEVDLGYFFNSGDDVFETKELGNMSAGKKLTRTFEIISYNRLLEEVGAEVYWYDY